MSIANEITRLINAKADIKSAIEAKGVAVGDETIDTYAGKIAEISGGGDNPLYYATSLNNIFSGATFPENHSIVIKLGKQVPMSSAFYNAGNLENITIIADDKESKALSYSGFTWYAYKIKKVDFSQYGIIKPTTISRMFYQNYPLKSIIGKFDLSENKDTFQWLNACSNLEVIEFVPNTIKISTPFNWCPKLNETSIQSIIDGLYDYRHLDLTNKSLAIVSGYMIESGTYKITNVYDDGDGDYRIDAGSQEFYYHREMNYGDDYIKLLTVGNDIVIEGDGYGENFTTTYFGINDNENTQGVSVTVTFHSTVGSNLTENQKKSIKDKNWILAY